MRVVLDTNVFISGIHWLGASEKVLRAWFYGGFVLVYSMPILDELVETLMSFKIPLKREEISWWESIILEKSVLVIPTQKVDMVKKDPDDNKFLEAALEGMAKYIVTQDKHLLEIGCYKKIRIVSPEEFLRRVQLKE